ncbi:MAG: S16 family serine protease [Candidatus Micrarchaeia archaeon]
MANAGSMLIGSASIHAPAVIIKTNEGTLTTILLNVTIGNGNVSIRGPEFVGNSTLNSALEGAMYAAKYLNVNFSHYNFTYYMNNDTNVSGPSAGGAMTLLAISALSNKPLKNNFTMTGTINANGSIGEIGGVYDKASAAKKAGMKFILVPAVPHSSSEAELYYLVQTAFDIPLIQVSNVSQALMYALNSSKINPYASESNYTFYTNYDVGSIPNASLECSNNCSSGIFWNLTLYTINLTARQINELQGNSNFKGVSSQLLKVLNQSRAIASKGYWYTGADFAFLDYINAFYFSNYNTNITIGMNTLQSIKGMCDSLNAPQITNTNYEYVLAGELRQLWANSTINATITLYNLTSTDTDGVLRNIYSGAEAMGWCSASSYLYNKSQALNGTPIEFSSSLKNTALAAIKKASKYDNFYLITAEQAYNNSNYALALIDASYAYALYTETSNMTTSQLLNATEELTANATYGIWATQYANEARFYASEAYLNKDNATLSEHYASEAYSIALLSNMISNDTHTIYTSMKEVPYTPGEIETMHEINTLENGVKSLREELSIALAAEVIVIALFTVIIILLLLQLNKQKGHKISHLKSKK